MPSRVDGARSDGAGFDEATEPNIDTDRIVRGTVSVYKRQRMQPVSTGTLMPKLPARPFWITRDTDPDTGQLEDAIDVWTKAPYHDGGQWFLDLAEMDDHHATRLTLTRAARVLPTLPDDDRQCVAYGA
jgi:hypothetical protein